MNWNGTKLRGLNWHGQNLKDWIELWLNLKSIICNLAKKKNVVHIELLNKIYKLHQSSIIYLEIWFVLKKKNVKDSLYDHTQIIWLLF